jgi:hypothetical protein
MKNLIVLYHKGDYDVGGLVRFLIKIFDDEHYKNILLNQFDMKVITSNDIESNLKKSDEEFIKHLNNSEDFENSIVFGIHPHGLSMVYKLNRNIKTKKNIKNSSILSNFFVKKGKWKII